MGDAPPFPGNWVKRESLPNGLDHAKSLTDIAWYNPRPGEAHGWNTGLTSETVQYWVRVDDARTDA